MGKTDLFLLMFSVEVYDNVKQDNIYTSILLYHIHGHLLMIKLNKRGSSLMEDTIISTFNIHVAQYMQYATHAHKLSSCKTKILDSGKININIVDLFLSLFLCGINFVITSDFTFECLVMFYCLYQLQHFLKI